MKKATTLIVAMMLAVTSLFAADLQQAVSKAVFETEQSQMCPSPLELSTTTFNGVPYALTSSNEKHNFYEPEKGQANYIDNTFILISPNASVKEITGVLYDLKDERNPEDAIYAFTRINDGRFSYNVVRVVTQDDQTMQYWFGFLAPKGEPKDGEPVFGNIVEENRTEWIEALAAWQAPEFDSRSFQCAWSKFRQETQTNDSARF